MSMQDSIADMFTVIRNGQLAKMKSIVINSSKQKIQIVSLLKDEGYIENFELDQRESNKIFLNIYLKYFNGKAVINSLKRVSRPGYRVYKKHNEIPKVMNGLGIAVVSTSKGLLTDYTAKSLGVGGEVICYIK